LPAASTPVKNNPQHFGAWRVTVAVSLFMTLAGAAGCGGIKLKPMPVIYGPGRVDLCSIVPESRRDPPVRVFYATNRTGKGPLDNRQYTNGVDKQLHLGTAVVDVGGKDATWDEICKASSGKGGNPTFHMRRAVELGTYDEGASSNASTREFSDAINEQLAIGSHRQVNIYVHGFRTNMPVEIETQAKLLHCMGRNGAVVCFAWPARQSLYLYGPDVERGMQSAHYLADLIELLASSTNADRINVLGYSCGAAVATSALCQLRERHKDEDPQQLSKRLRIGNVILACVRHRPEDVRARRTRPPSRTVGQPCRLYCEQRHGPGAVQHRFRGVAPRAGQTCRSSS
jgi:esterase/lipase superfamily enzyme